MQIFTVIFVIGFLGGACAYRFKRQNAQFPACAGGARAVATCFKPQNSCYGNYTCDVTIGGFCCPNRTTTAAAFVFPICTSGISSSAGCINGGCNQGYQCNRIGTLNMCCRVCPNNATSFGVCTRTTPCANANTVCNLPTGATATTQGLCCTSTSTPAGLTGQTAVTIASTGSTVSTLPTGCPNNVPSLGVCSPTTACSNTATQTCVGTVCCPVCTGGAASPGPCVANSCAAFPAAPTCSQGICCPGTASTECPAGQRFIGPCLTSGSQCPPTTPTTTCVNNVNCCQAASTDTVNL